MNELFEFIEMKNFKVNQKKWLELCKEIKIELGAKSHAFEKYVSLVLKTFHDTLAWSDSDYGDEEALRFLSICIKLAENKEVKEDKEYYFYNAIKNFVYSNPLPYNATQTKGHIYFCNLFYDWLDLRCFV